MPGLTDSDPIHAAHASPAAPRPQPWLVPLLHYLTVKYHGIALLRNRDLAALHTVGDVLRFYRSTYIQTRIARGDDVDKWRAARLYRALGVHSVEELPPNVTIDKRITPERPLPFKFRVGGQQRGWARKWVKRQKAAAAAATTPSSQA